MKPHTDFEWKVTVPPTLRLLNAFPLPKGLAVIIVKAFVVLTALLVTTESMAQERGHWRDRAGNRESISSQQHLSDGHITKTITTAEAALRRRKYPISAEERARYHAQVKTFLKNKTGRTLTRSRLKQLQALLIRLAPVAPAIVVGTGLSTKPETGRVKVFSLDEMYHDEFGAANDSGNSL